MHWFLYVPFEDLLWLRTRMRVFQKHDLVRELDIIISHVDDQFDAGDGIASRRGLM